MKISIITVCYNSESTIAQTIASVRNQDYKDIEHLIIDGDSTDGTMKIVNTMTHNRMRVVTEKDFGLYDAMNKGLSMSQGEIVGFLNSDDMYASNNVLSSIAKSLSNPNYDCCFSDMCYVKSDKSDEVVRYLKSSAVPPDAFLNSWVPAHPTFYVRRKFLDEVGQFNLCYKYAADFDFMLRCIKVHKLRAKYVPEVWVMMRIGGASNKSVRNIYLQNIEILNSMKAFGLEISLLYFFYNKLVDRMYQMLRAKVYGTRNLTQNS